MLLLLFIDQLETLPSTSSVPSVRTSFAIEDMESVRPPHHAAMIYTTYGIKQRVKFIGR